MAEFHNIQGDGMSSSSTEEEKLAESQSHGPEGEMNNYNPNVIEDQDSSPQDGHPVHKAVSTASEKVPFAAKLEGLRETASFGTVAPDTTPEVETSPELEEEELQATLKSFVEAVHNKYNDLEVKGVSDAIKNIVLVPKSGPVKMTASGNIVLPRQVSMSGCEISVAGDTDLIQRMCQRVKELDLMENNITCWDEVLCIIECIPHLTFLNLTKNHLTSDLPDLTERTLPSISHLVLNDTMITWVTLLRLLAAFPSVEELHLSLNAFEYVDIPTTHSVATSSPTSDNNSYPALKKLFFIGNKITNWSEVNKLGAFFPSLEFLILSETDLSTIDGADEIPECFPCLQTLGLNRTLLGTWQEIEKLRLFPSLTDVRLNAISFLEAFPEQFRRQHTVALLPNITTLNGSPVKETEREDSERAYIRLYMDKPEKTKRYYELEKQHGKLDPLVKVQLKPKKQVKLKVRVEGPNQEEIKVEDVDIDVSQTIRDLKKTLSNVAGCPAAKFTLFYLDSECNFGIDRLIYMDRKVFSYNMQEGDEIIIALKERSRTE